MTDVRIVTSSLGGTALSQLLQRGQAPAAWMPPAPRTPAEWRTRALGRAKERSWEECWQSLEPAMLATGKAAERLRRVRAEGGVVITTGQQPGLFGGPIYTFSKAMGALALADVIERETGVATAAVFWAATDDADFAEAASTVIARAGGVDVLRSEFAPPAGTPMSLAPLGDMTALLARLRDGAGSAADTWPLEAVDTSYGDASRTVGDAFVHLLRTLLEPFGMPVLDASHSAVRAASDAVLRAALTGAEPIERALVQRGRDIRGAGMETQVVDVPGLTLVFTRDDTVKRRLPVSEAESASRNAKAWLTPNVLLRPIVEQAILPTIAYVAGPGELAYFAQVSAVADALGMAQPLALPRWSCTIIEPAAERLLERFNVQPGALDQPDALEGAVARAVMRTESGDALAALRDAIAALPGALAPEAGPLGLGGAVEGAMQSLHHRVDRLERRLVAGIKRREQGVLRDVATLRAMLRPLDMPQERVLNLMPILSRHTRDVLVEMHASAMERATRLVQGSVAS
ncbi:bacillithiol biosynthesis cysteine-adding enzyme BshC [soil metagenome]